MISEIYQTPRVVTDLSTCFFYHVTDIPGIGLQDAPWDLRGSFTDYIGDVDCRGMRVLDVGCASGFLSFSAEQHGAREVVSFDMDDATRQHLLPFHDKEYYQDHAAWVVRQTAFIEKWHNAYWLAHRAIGSKALVCHGDVYDIPAAIGQFDLVIVGALLEHLSDPIRALASITRRCAGTLVINTDVLDTEEPTARFDGKVAQPEHDYVFWTYSIGVYRAVLGMLGFRIVRTVAREFHAKWAAGMFPRTAIVAERIA